MGQFEYGVDLAAKPGEMSRIALAFRAGEQKERDRIRNLLIELSSGSMATEALGSLHWTLNLVKELGVSEEDKVV